MSAGDGEGKGLFGRLRRLQEGKGMEGKRDDDEYYEPDEKMMGFLDHLEELRKALIRIIITLALGTAVCYYFVRHLLSYILSPAGIVLQYLSPFEAFFAQLKVAFALGLYTTLPIIALFIWRFISPAIKRRRKAWAIPFIIAIFIFFTIGAGFAYYILPVTMQFFRSFEMEGQLEAHWSVGRYVDFVLRMLIGFGVVFEGPVVVFFLARLGILSARTMLSKWKWFILGIFILSAVITPGQDVFSMLLLSAPLLLLYFISILVAWVVYPRQKMEE